MTVTGIESKKHQLRDRVMRRLTTQKEEDRRRKSQAIHRKLARMTVFRRATVVCCYVSMPHEVDTWLLVQRMIETGKRVVIPRVKGRRLLLSELRDLQQDLRPGAFNVWEPKPRATRSVHRKDLDLVLVPGVAFDRRGHRLGHGKGYFDRFLARLPRW